MNFLHSTIDALRDRYTPVTHTSTFRATGQVTPEEFVQAGDFLVYKFPSWSWAGAGAASRRVAYLPEGKQYLVTRGVPCRRRLDDFESAVGVGDTTVEKGAAGAAGGGAGGDDDEGWLKTGGDAERVERGRVGQGAVRALDGSGGDVRERDEGSKDDEDDEIPDMEDEEDDNEAIIRDTHAGANGLRKYNLYITYTPYYRTPRLYLSGYAGSSEPLAPALMMEDIVGDYADKTVTLEDFPFGSEAGSDAATTKMASIHPCRHASVMKVLLERADAALRRRREREREKGAAGRAKVALGMEGLVDEARGMSLGDKPAQQPPMAAASTTATAGAAGGADEWEVLSEGGASGGGAGELATSEGDGADEPAIRVDQYLVVFLKFMASVTPTIEHDFTMGL